jgi:hypothetical protein
MEIWANYSGSVKKKASGDRRKKMLPREAYLELVKS